MTGRATKEFRVALDDSRDCASTNDRTLLLATMRASYDAL
jgi:hypothetical protein